MERTHAPGLEARDRMAPVGSGSVRKARMRMVAPHSGQRRGPLCAGVPRPPPEPPAFERDGLKPDTGWELRSRPFVVPSGGRKPSGIVYPESVRDPASLPRDPLTPTSRRRPCPIDASSSPPLRP
jgi:hypothetical protein